MLQIAIVTDHLKISKQVMKYMEHYAKEKEIELQYTLFENGYQFITDMRLFDVLIIDQHLKDGYGITYATKKRINNKYLCICLLGKMNENDTQHLQIYPLYYLEEPITRISIRHFLNEIVNYMHLSDQHTYFKYYTTTGMVSLDSDDILYFEYQGKSMKYNNRSVIIHTYDHEFVLRTTLRTLEEQMLSDSFYMPHQSFLVNMSNIKAIKGYALYLNNGEMIPLSQRRSAAFRKHFKQYVKTHAYMIKNSKEKDL